MPERIPQSVTIRVPIQAFLTGTTTPATGKTIAITISKNAAAYGNPSGGATNATEIASGSYYVDLSTTDSGTLGPLWVLGTGSGIDNVVAIYDVVKATNGGFSALPDTASASNASLLTAGSGTAQVATSGGVVNASVTQWNGFAVGAVNTNGYPVVDLAKIAGNTASASGTVTFPAATLASTSNITTVGAVAGAVGSVTGNVGGSVNSVVSNVGVGSIATDAITAAALATSAVQEIRNAITGGAYALNTDALGSIRIVDGTGTGEIDTVAGAVAHVILTDTTTNLTNAGPDQAGVSTLLTRLSALRAGYLDNLSAGAVATAASIAALNNLSSAQVLADVETALATTTRSMPGQSTPSTTPTLVQAILQLFQQATNYTTQDASALKVYDRSGTTVQQKRTASDDGTTTVLQSVVTGP